MRKIDHQNAMKKAEYEDQLRQQAKDRNMQRDLELAKRQEELKRRKFFSVTFRSKTQPLLLF